MGLYLLKYPARRVLAPLAASLGWLHPDVVSYLAVPMAAAAGACYLFAADRPGLLLAAIALTLLRMALNTLDGVLALRRGKLSLRGEIVNALPDRYSDILLVGAIALSPLCHPAVGLAALASMLLVSYTGMLGKAVGVDWQHHGPMGKVERLICVMAFTLAQYLRLRSGSAAWAVLGLSVTPLEAAMLLVLVGGQAAVFNRLRAMLRQVRRLEWRQRRDPGPGRSAGRALVAYDSRTGNTAKVAAAIAEGLGADLKHVDEHAPAGEYDLVVIGSPVISSGPTDKAVAFLRSRPAATRYAAFVTYGAPLGGPISAEKAFAAVTEAAGEPPVASFTCKGRHALVRWLQATRPNEDDLLRAFLFGMKLTRSGGRSP